MIYVQCKRCDVIYPANREHVCAQSSKPSRKPTTRPAVPTLTSKPTSKSASDRIAKPPKPAFDRVAYQRDYMRARRARQKAQE